MQDQATDAVETTETEEATKKSRRKLMKEIDGTVVKIEALGGNNGVMEFEFLELPDEIQEKFGPFGLSHKLGDSAAGKAGVEAEESISKVWEGLMAGDWTVRAPAAPKVSVKKIAANYEKLEPAEKAAAKALLDSLGIDIPGLE